MNEYKLIKIKNLTPDVYELVFNQIKGNIKEPKAGEFITFFPPILGQGRAYSIADYKEGNFKFIIKKLENGRGGSKELCELKQGVIIKGVGPVGKFILNENNSNKMFIGTGTGFVPLYFQIKKSLELGLKGKIRLIFGVRFKEDMFYIKQLEDLKKLGNFEYNIYLSKDETQNTTKGYVTDYLNENNVVDYDDFYICGSPAMVESSIKLLEKLNKKNIYYEKY